jgi:hypothetical protein
MLYPGKKFSLLKEALAIMIDAGKRHARYLPVGALLTVVPTYNADDTSVEVEWEGQIVTMFTVDLEARGKRMEAPEPTTATRKRIARAV